MSHLHKQVFALICVALTLLACDGLEPIRLGGSDAELDILGANVFVNGARVSDPGPIRPGDSIATGPGSSARVTFPDGTTMQLDQNSDPDVSWEGGVLTVRVGPGRFLFDTRRWRVRVVNDLAVIAMGSRVAVEVSEARFIARVLEGTATLLRPEGETVGAGRKIIVARNGQVTYAQMTAQEIRETERTFRRWVFPFQPRDTDRSDGGRGSTQGTGTPDNTGRGTTSSDRGASSDATNAN